MRFHSRLLLKTALSNVTLPRRVRVSKEVEDKITGVSKHHTNGDLTMAVLRDSQVGPVTLLKHPKFGQALLIMSVGIADGICTDENGAIRPTGSKIFILTSAFVKKDEFDCLTAYPLKDVNEYKTLIAKYGLSQKDLNEMFKRAR